MRRRIGSVTVVGVSWVAPEHGAHGPAAELLVGLVDRIMVRRVRVGRLAAQLRGGRQELGVGDRDRAVDRRRDNVDVRVIRGPESVGTGSSDW